MPAQSRNGYTSFSSATRNIKKEKTALKEDGFPPEKTKALVERYVREKVNLPEDSVLYVAPSTSQVNIMPYMIAKQLQKDNPSATIVNNALTPLAKIREPVEYRVNKDHLIANRPAYVIDDVVTTGETTDKIREILESNNIKVDGVISIGQSEQRISTARDIERLAEKLNADKDLVQDINTVLKGRLKHKSNYIEREVTNGTESAKQEFRDYFKSEAGRLSKLEPGARESFQNFTGRATELRFGKNQSTGMDEGQKP